MAVDYQKLYAYLVGKIDDALELLEEGDLVKAAPIRELLQNALLRAEEALYSQNFHRCAALLDSATNKTLRWHYLKAQMYFTQKQYADARPHYEAAWDYAPKNCCSRLEDCCRETSDFAGAYFYACKLRELTG